jgi:hypothetical protein
LQHWSDTKIFKANKVNIVTGYDFEGLFSMLDKHRFDHFPRAVIEVQGELNRHNHLDLSIAKNTLIHYPTAYVFYVNYDNQELYDDLLSGLNQAFKEGKFDQHFEQHFGEYVAPFLQQSHTIFELDNPYLLPDLPHPDSKTWLRFKGKRVSRQGYTAP